MYLTNIICVWVWMDRVHLVDRYNTNSFSKYSFAHLYLRGKLWRSTVKFLLSGNAPSSGKERHVHHWRWTQRQWNESYPSKGCGNSGKMSEVEVALLGWVSFPDVEGQSRGEILRTKTGRQAGYGVRRHHRDKQVFTPQAGQLPAPPNPEQDLCVSRGYKHWAVRDKG